MKEFRIRRVEARHVFVYLEDDFDLDDAVERAARLFDSVPSIPESVSYEAREVIR